MSAPFSAVFQYPNPTALGIYKPTLRSNFRAENSPWGSQANYSLSQYSGYGKTSFNFGSILPLETTFIDRFATPIQFRGRQEYAPVLDSLVSRRLPFPQGIPYNLGITDPMTGMYYHYGSQQYNLTRPVAGWGSIPYGPQAFSGWGSAGATLG
jgi:hypothetical protein